MLSEKKRLPIAAHEQFCSDERGGPFRHCLVCDSALDEPFRPYLVQKAYRRRPQYDVEELVFEIALCLLCRDALAERFSDHSRASTKAFLDEHLDIDRRTRRLWDRADEEEPDVNRWVDRCMFDETPRHRLEEYQLVALARGPWLMVRQAPFLIGGAALEAMHERLSEETKRENDRFWQEHLGPSPELQEILDGPLLV